MPMRRVSRSSLLGKESRARLCFVYVQPLVLRTNLFVFASDRKHTGHVWCGVG